MADQWSAPAVNESVVISYGIVNAKLIVFLRSSKWCNKKERKSLRFSLFLTIPVPYPHLPALLKATYP